MEPKHSLAFILDRQRERERERESLAWQCEATATATTSTMTRSRPSNSAFAVAGVRSAPEATPLYHETYRVRHRAVSTPSYEYDDYSEAAARRRQTSAFPYQFPYQTSVDQPPRSAPPALDDLPTLPSLTRLVRPQPAAILRTLPTVLYDSPSSSSSAAQPRHRRRPMTAEEKRAARQCSMEGCKNYTIDRGLCFRHGGGKTCAVEDCGRSAKARGLCWRHGGSVQCTVEGCDRGAKSKGLCWSHGGGNKCSIDGCEKTIISKGLCWTHGGGKRCSFEGCMRPASESKQNFCNRHHAELRDGTTVYEV